MSPKKEGAEKTVELPQPHESFREVSPLAHAERREGPINPIEAAIERSVATEENIEKKTGSFLSGLRNRMSTLASRGLTMLKTGFGYMRKAPEAIAGGVAEFGNQMRKDFVGPELRMMLNIANPVKLSDEQRERLGDIDVALAKIDAERINTSDPEKRHALVDRQHVLESEANTILNPPQSKRAGAKLAADVGLGLARGATEIVDSVTLTKEQKAKLKSIRGNLQSIERILENTDGGDSRENILKVKESLLAEENVILALPQSQRVGGGLVKDITGGVAEIGKQMKRDFVGPELRMMLNIANPTKLTDEQRERLGDINVALAKIDAERINTSDAEKRHALVDRQHVLESEANTILNPPQSKRAGAKVGKEGLSMLGDVTLAKHMIEATQGNASALKETLQFFFGLREQKNRASLWRYLSEEAKTLATGLGFGKKAETEEEEEDVQAIGGLAASLPAVAEVIAAADEQDPKLAEKIAKPITELGALSKTALKLREERMLQLERRRIFALQQNNAMIAASAAAAMNGPLLPNRPDSEEILKKIEQARKLLDDLIEAPEPMNLEDGEWAA